MSDMCLYILMRMDLASLNPGKAVAQGSHAANQCIFEACNDPRLDEMVKEWQGQTKGGFGCCVVLGVTDVQMRRTVAMAQEIGLHANITHDPSYPVQDGQVVHHIPLDTCGYVFARKQAAQIVVADLTLLP